MVWPEILGEDHFDPSRQNFRPFSIGRISDSKGFIHVLDDFSLDVLIETLDTAPDLARYLEHRAKLIQSRRLFASPGEEELLAYYLRNADETGEHCFRIPNGYSKLCVEEGSWEFFRNHPERRAQVKANEVSYAWDGLIETFCKHLLEGTQYFHSTPNGSNQEVGIRFLAREGRMRRRMLTGVLLGALEMGANHDRMTRVVLPSNNGDPHYVFLTLKRRSGYSDDQYRSARGGLLRACCLVTRLLYPDAQHVVGIGTEPLSSNPLRSEDLMYFNGAWWDDELAREAIELRGSLGLLVNTKTHRTTEPEYPLQRNLQMKKGRNRNRTCYCGSGKKYKKCHGATTEQT